MGTKGRQMGTKGRQIKGVTELALGCTRKQLDAWPPSCLLSGYMKPQHLGADFCLDQFISWILPSFVSPWPKCIPKDSDLPVLTLALWAASVQSLISMVWLGHIWALEVL